MRMDHLLRRGAAIAAAVAAVVATPAGATTLIRAGLEDLTATNDTIVVGEVLSAHSYWNAEGTFILTDVRVAPAEVLKGRVRGRELEITLMGGTVGDLTTLIVGGAQLDAGRLVRAVPRRGGPAGRAAGPTVRHHSQGAFDVVLRDGGPARRQPGEPDAAPARQSSARPDAPGGAAGLAFEGWSSRSASWPRARRARR